jgi:hypothetical protein
MNTAQYTTYTTCTPICISRFLRSISSSCSQLIFKTSSKVRLYNEPRGGRQVICCAGESFQKTMGAVLGSGVFNSDGTKTHRLSFIH